jgi:DNA polymerase-3 subunit beta
MQFSCESAQLAKAVNTVRKAISSSPNAPIFSGIHLLLSGNELKLVAMDINFSMEKTLEVNGNEDGTVLVPAQYIGDLLSRFNDQVLTVSKADNDSELNISTETGNFNIPIMDDKEFPAMPVIQEERVLTLPDETIHQLIRQTVYACSNDDQRPLFNGVYLEKKGQNITCVGTNTHRLAIKSVTVDTLDDSEYSMLIPSRMLKEIAANLNGDLPEDVSLFQQKNQLLVRLGTLKILCTLIEGKFPDFRKPIPESFNNRSLVNRVEMERIIQRVSLFSQDSYNIVRLAIEGDKITFSSAAGDRGQGREVLSCITEGSELPLNIAFNSKYLMEFFKNIDTDEVILETNSSLSPARMVPKDDSSYMYIVTPVRVIF